MEKLCDRCWQRQEDGDGDFFTLSGFSYSNIL